MADAEVIVIGIDNSRWIPNSSGIFKDQCDAIEFYCRAKFEENPDTVVGLFTMSSCNSGHLLYPPTGSLEEIVAMLPTINSGTGQVDLLRTLSFGRLPFVLDDQDKKKRMTLFVGGLTNLATVFADSFGKTLRDTGVAVDVIDFYLGEPPKPSMSDYQFGRRHLEEFINICNGNDNDNSHIVHVGRTDSIRDVLSESILKKTPRLFQKENVNVKRRVGGEESSAARGNKYGEHVTLSKGGGSNRVLEEKNVNVKRRAGGEESSAARGIKYEHVTLSKKKTGEA